MRHQGDPEISVVVPTFNGASRLPGLITALEAQVDAPPFEVVVVDDGSEDQTWPVLMREAQSCTMLRPIRLSANRGAAVARNAGWRASRGAVIAFTDDDCLPQPNWLAALAERIKSVDIVQGRTIPNPDQRQHLSWFSHTVVVDHERGFYETCNIAYRREVLEQAGGFDERFCKDIRSGRGGVYGDDTDLGWRAKAIGARSSFEGEAVVWHDVHAGDLKSRLRLLPRQAGLVLAVRRHPEIRKSFDNRWFYQRAHPRALLVMGAIVQLALRPFSPPSWILAVALMLPWAHHRMSQVRRADWLQVLPRLLVFDVAETAVFARATIRYRAWLL